MKTIRNITLLLSLICVVCSCTKSKTPPYQIDTNSESSNALTVHYEEKDGVKIIPVTIQGNKLDMIFDTGASGMHMSWLEIISLVKQGKITSDDFCGYSLNTIANGDIVNLAKFNLKEVIIGEGDNCVKLHDIETTVDDNITAPLLVGNGVLDKFASFEVDNKAKVIKFTKK